MVNFVNFFPPNFLSLHMKVRRIFSGGLCMNMCGRLSHLWWERGSGRVIFLHYYFFSLSWGKHGNLETGLPGWAYRMCPLLSYPCCSLSTTAGAWGGWSVSQVAAVVAVMKWRRNDRIKNRRESLVVPVEKKRRIPAILCLGLLCYIMPSFTSQRSTLLVHEIL